MTTREDLWDHSLGCAVAAKFYCRGKQRQDDDQCGNCPEGASLRESVAPCKKPEIEERSDHSDRAESGALIRMR